jgi:hypothetical protein
MSPDLSGFRQPSTVGGGKSELARELARQHLKKYSDGTFFIIADDQNLLFELSRLRSVSSPIFQDAFLQRSEPSGRFRRWEQRQRC